MKGEYMSDAVETKEQIEEVETKEVQPEEKKDNSLTSDQVKELITEAVQETNQTWQSRFDKLRQEKEEEKKTKETIEEKIARIEKERIEERLGFAREKLIAKSGLDENIYNLASKLSADDVNEIESGVNGLVEFINNEVQKQLKEKLDKDYADKFSTSKQPKAGNVIDLDAQIAAAQKSGNIAKVLDLKRQKQRG